jgi:hypothetical protein
VREVDARDGHARIDELADAVFGRGADGRDDLRVRESESALRRGNVTTFRIECHARSDDARIASPTLSYTDHGASLHERGAAHAAKSSLGADALDRNRTKSAG